MSTDSMIQHTGNAAAIVIPAATFWAHVSPVITVIVGTLGIVWYSVLFTEKIVHWYKRWRRQH